ncbi:hypothetical protein N7492_009536 [Penicillium capsulatum]|uniref:NTF2 domain-containing protein n=1 Tax=Penicillium capsulatum TaxID=69766 RepID=A0A9W9LHZ9_9EURO|nr:hypothetical protein N7492_009536 [Penicillium capsulatum]KAJ6106925.1 hypothetical protein N7512_010442 [Penicillium capsulatum]
MTGIIDDTLTNVSTDAATKFVQSYYRALESNRDSIGTFYDPAPTKLLFNGNDLANGVTVQDVLKQELGQVHFEVQSFDCQIINRAFPTVTPTGVPKAPTQMTAKDMSVLVLVSGNVRYGGRDNPQRCFSETFILVPNASADRTNAQKEWLIQSQNFRLVV